VPVYVSPLWKGRKQRCLSLNLPPEKRLVAERGVVACQDGA
jgi:hypothetical protein